MLLQVTPTFSKAEMDRRIAMVRKYMAENDIGGTLFTSMHNVNYFSDFLYCSFGRPYGLVVTADKVTSISAGIDAGQPWRRTSTGGNVVYTDWQRDNFWAAVQQELADVPSGSKIGCEFDHMTLDNKVKLDKAVSGKGIVDVGTPMMMRRLIKSDEEIALITEGARICDLGGKAVVDAIAEGVGEHEVALRGTEAMVMEIAKSFPDAELRDSKSPNHLPIPLFIFPVIFLYFSLSPIFIIFCLPCLSLFRARGHQSYHGVMVLLRNWNAILQGY